MEPTFVWPDPVPCHPENPIQGIRTCIARRKNIKCPWLKVDYCGVSTDDMSDALEELGLHDLSWVFEDEIDADDVAEAATDLRKEIEKRPPGHGDAAIAVRWFANYLDALRDHGAGLTDRFAERIDRRRDRY